MTSILPILAEVSDKEPTVIEMWVTTGVLAAVLAGVSWPRKWCAIVTTPIAAFFVYAVWDWLRDPFEGPAIVRELGRGYVIHAYASALLPLFCVVLVFLRAQKTKLGRSRPNKTVEDNAVCAQGNPGGSLST